MWATLMLIELESKRKELCTCGVEKYYPGAHKVSCPYAVPAWDILLKAEFESRKKEYEAAGVAA